MRCRLGTFPALIVVLALPAGSTAGLHEPPAPPAPRVEADEPLPILTPGDVADAAMLELTRATAGLPPIPEEAEQAVSRSEPPVAASPPQPPAAAPAGSPVPAVRGGRRVVRAGTPAAPVEQVSVYEHVGVSDALVTRARRAAASAGARSALVRAQTIGFTRLVRDGRALLVPYGPGYRFPITAAVYGDATRGLLGEANAGALDFGLAVMSDASAALRDARVGDTLELVGPRGAVVPVLIGRIEAAAVVGAELALPPVVAARLDPLAPSRVAIWDVASRADLDRALAAEGLPSATVRVRHSWDPPDPDSGLSLATLKALAGEFSYQPPEYWLNGRLVVPGVTTVDPRWPAANVVRLTFSGVAVRASCHVRAIPALQAVLTDLAEQGLGHLVDLANTNRYGGCFAPRTVRGNPNALSRHTWAMAFDMNTTQNPLGAVPRLDCRVVRVFREHGFAWGGNFLRPDGMHFEYVGEPRHRWAYPSTYCPNLLPGAAGDVP